MLQPQCRGGSAGRATTRGRNEPTIAHADPQARVRAVLEAAGLRVTDLHVFPERPYRWSVRVLAEETTELTIRDLTVVDVVRYWRRPGLPDEPDEFVVTVDHLIPDPALRGR